MSYQWLITGEDDIHPPGTIYWGTTTLALLLYIITLLCQCLELSVLGLLEVGIRRSKPADLVRWFAEVKDMIKYMDKEVLESNNVKIGCSKKSILKESYMIWSPPDSARDPWCRTLLPLPSMMCRKDTHIETPAWSSSFVCGLTVTLGVFPGNAWNFSKLLF